MDRLAHRELGSSGIEVSVLSLGSWLTFERITREAGLAVMNAARQAGIDFLDDARYDDPTGTAPIPTGYSEVVFGELFRAAGWKRDEVVVANKLWFEFWPGQSVAEELDASLGRMGFEHLDLLYCTPPPPAADVAELVGSVAEVIEAGKARAWGMTNWTAAQTAAGYDAAVAAGSPPPCATQLPYNVVSRSWVEAQDMVDVLDRTGTGVVASAVLAGGVLTGKYGTPAATGRVVDQLDSPRLQPALRAATELRSLAEELATTPAALAIAFALGNPRVVSVLFGATTPHQVADNLQALELADPAIVARVATIDSAGST